MATILTSKVTSGHSAKVQMTLIIGGISHQIGQLGPDFIILANPFTAPPSKAEIVMDVDGHVDRWEVFLSKGVSPNLRRVPINPFES
jgi:hypothetical protein